MGNKILDLFMSRNFLLDKGALDFLSGFSEEVVDEVVEILDELGIKEKIVTRDLFERYRDEFGGSVFGVSGCRIREVGIGVRGVGVSDNGCVKVLSDLVGSSKGLKVEDFVGYFRSRYEVIKGKLENGNFENLSAIRRVGDKGGVYSIIGMVYSKRMTKNGNLLLEVEDLTGKILVLVNKENSGLFDSARD